MIGYETLVQVLQPNIRFLGKIVEICFSLLKIHPELVDSRLLLHEHVYFFCFFFARDIDCFKRIYFNFDSADGLCVDVLFFTTNCRRHCELLVRKTHAQMSFSNIRRHHFHSATCLHRQFSATHSKARRNPYRVLS